MSSPSGAMGFLIRLIKLLNSLPRRSPDHALAPSDRSRALFSGMPTAVIKTFEPTHGSRSARKSRGVLVGHRRDRCPDGLQQGLSATRLGLAQEALHLGEGLFDRVEVRSEEHTSELQSRQY